MKTSEKGIALIKKYESCRLQAYICPSGVLTVGWGHTGADVKSGMTITQSKADNLLKKDLKKFESHVNKYNKIYKFTQYEYDALVSFAYNVGNIDTLTRKGTRTKKEIADSMLLYNKGGGVVLKGLENRRKDEHFIFLGYTTMKMYKVIAISGLNCRYKDNEDSKLIGTFSHGATLQGLEDCGAWIKVKGKDCKGKEIQGYVCKKYLKVVVESKLKV